MDDKLEASEDFLGMMDMASCNAKSIVTSIKDILLSLNLPLANCRGQCYDGASTMSGHKSGVSTLIYQVMADAARTLMPTTLPNQYIALIPQLQ